MVRGERCFYMQNEGLQAQSVLLVAEAWDQPGRVLLDPNTFSVDGTVALADFEPGPDGRLLAYATSDGGSDWRTWRFLDVDTGEHLPDVLTRNKFGRLEWLAASEPSVVYARYERGTEDAGGGSELRDRNAAPEICLHRLGTAEREDRVVRPRPAEGRNQYFTTSADRELLVVSEVDTATRNTAIEVLGYSAGRFWPTALVEGFDARHQYVGNDGERFWLRTDLDAPRRRVVEVPLLSPARENWRTIVPERAETLEQARAVGGRLVLSYLVDACARVFIVDPRAASGLDPTAPTPLPLPLFGSVTGIAGRFDQEHAYLTYTDFTTPARVLRVHVPSAAVEPFRTPSVALDPERFVTRQVLYDSADGTRVPLFLVHRADLELDGERPTLLYGYGGFDISMKPAFSVPNTVWIEAGGVYAVACLRGGGEYGEDWHAAGTKLRKQNVFDDFIAAAEWLVEAGYTRPARLAIAGGSNGGLLVGACLTQRPELFGAALPAVGVLDMLRYHLFTIGWAWAGDYGTVDDEAEFRALLAYSPLHNVADGAAYPPTLVTTAARDDRVVPAHSYKFTARLQAAQAGDAPVLIRVETRAGHGAGKPTEMQIDEAADRLAFLDYALRWRSK